MRVIFKIMGSLLGSVREDLLRPHAFAAERVGFLSCRMGKLKPQGVIILAHEYQPVADGDYVDDRTVGAMIGSEAIRKALQFAHSHDVGMFHVHLHDHSGCPRPSRTDVLEMARLIPDFWHVRRETPHGAIIISRDSVSGRCWYPGRLRPCDIAKIAIVGPGLVLIRN